MHTRGLGRLSTCYPEGFNSRCTIPFSVFTFTPETCRTLQKANRFSYDKLAMLPLVLMLTLPRELPSLPSALLFPGEPLPFLRRRRTSLMLLCHTKESWRTQVGVAVNSRYTPIGKMGDPGRGVEDMIGRKPSLGHGVTANQPKKPKLEHACETGNGPEYELMGASSKGLNTPPKSRCTDVFDLTQADLDSEDGEISKSEAPDQSNPRGLGPYHPDYNPAQVIPGAHQE